MFRPENLYKLMTKEDPLHFHKILGGIVLANYLYRYTCFFFYGHMNFSKSHWDTALLAVHGLLSVSSLAFHISGVRNPQQPMIYPEYRLHSILFALRSVACCLLAIWQYHYVYTMAVCGSTLMLADLITTYYNPVGNNGSTMRNMPFDKSIPLEEQNQIVSMQSASQIGATLFMFGNAETAFSPMLAIQLAALLMTLVRKSIIDAYMWHFVYSLSLWINNVLFYSATPGFFVMFLAIYNLHYYVVFPYRINKYVAWIFHFTLIALYKETGVENRVNTFVLPEYAEQWHWFMGEFIAAVYVWLFYCYRGLYGKFFDK